ncbi:penicillin-binding protein 2 [bacterium]|nr:penicillin-binding protein 2 [bacterium]
MTPMGPAEDSVWSRRRARVIAVGLGLAFAVIVGRTAYISLAGHEAGPARAVVAQAQVRADIVDRNGDLLATSLPAFSLAADPRAVWDAADVAAALGTVLPDIDIAATTERLADRTRHFVWIERGLSPRQRQLVFGLGLEGLFFVEETRRVYPRGRLLGHLLGFTNIDGEGVEGLERAYDRSLTREGAEPLRLTIDAGVQYALESELDLAAEEFDMKGAAGVVIDSTTGAVRAAASWPSVDPNRPRDSGEAARLNRVFNAVYELGSIYKPLTVAAALESGVLSLDETFDVSAPIRVGPATVRDHNIVVRDPHRATLVDIIAQSSNIGTVLIAQKIGPRRQHDFLETIGLLSRPEHEGPTSAAPLTPAEWDGLTSATVSYGHGVAVSPLSFAAAFTAFGDGGETVAPRFVEPVTADSIERKRVMSAPTAAVVVELMRQTVIAGTGRNADAPGYQVAGKTGTAEKPGPDGYDPDRNITSFAAVFPASRPQFVVLIVLDEATPKTGGPRTASATAASIAGRLIARTAPMLNVEPVFDAPSAPAPEMQVVRETRAL